MASALTTLPSVQELEGIARTLRRHIVRMIAGWAMERERVAEAPGSLDLVAFGRALLECTTMPEERELIRACIPGLPDEEHRDAVTLF